MGLKRNAKRRVYSLSGLTADNQEISRTNSKTGGGRENGKALVLSQREIIRRSFCFFMSKNTRSLNDSKDGKTFTQSQITTSSGDIEIDLVYG